jgi:hypothetical protein
MIINKIMETYVDIADPNDMYNDDIDLMLLNKLKEKFVGICYKSCYILDIIRIIRRSSIYMKDTLEGDANLSVMFEVSAIQYLKNEIINGCKIVKKEANGIVHAKSQYAGIQFNIPASMSIFKEGDTVPVIVNLVRYNVNQSAISVLAHPFMPQNSEPIYYKIKDDLTSELNKEESKNIDSLLEQVSKIEKDINKLQSDDKKVYKFFVDLLSEKNSAGNKNTKRKPIYDILKIKKGTLYFDDVYDSNNINTLEKDNDKDCINERPFIVYSFILINYMMRLQTICDFVRYYPKFADIQENKHLWKFYLSLKK